ncbi:MAG: outer membrane protein assembly factor BamA [Gammaproteobacteria bacterium]|nr:outer membrane protein assembly factor BamA [Gammaproteobacteria bacterium]
MKKLFWITVLVLLSISARAHAEEFVVDNIEVVGIKKIAIGTVFSYLPINVGETLDLERSPEIIRELFSTGFFDDIALRRRGNTLIIAVKERPSIGEVNFEGNDDIEDEALQEALEGLGMAKGRIFDEHKLEQLELELQQVYYSLGKYAARIEASWRELDEDRVAIDIDISEGVSAKIHSINITGNRDFSERELLEIFELESTDSGWFADDEYSGTRLSADLESLRSYYLDRGYIQYDTTSQQVTISPDRKDINITINIREGQQFRLDQIGVGGEMVVPEGELKALISLRLGDVFSRKDVNRVIEAMQKRLGEDGYAYAEVRVATDINEEDRTVSIQFLVFPGKKMRVRYINFSGNAKTQDLVLRREMRQFEGEMYQRSKVDRSRIRLQRLNYIGSVDFALERVVDSEDEVDINVTVSERFTGNLQVGLGFSQVQGAILNLGFSHDNILGTGKSLSLTFDNSAARERYAFSFRDPYWTKDGVSRGFNFSFTETDASENNTSNFLSDSIQASVDFGIPLSEFNTLRLEAGVLRTDIKTTSGSSEEVIDFLIDNSDDFDENTPRDEVDEARFDTVFGATRLSKDTRNRRIFASQGHLNSINFEVHNGDLDFYRARYQHRSAFELSELLTLSYRGRIGYGDGYGDTDDLPLFEKFTAGGVRSVRGYDGNSLGPEDSNGDPLGGNLQVLSSAEVLLPLEALGSSETFRLAVYWDVGNVYEDADAFEADELRQSVGLSAKWFSVVGPIEFSYAFPLNDEPGDDTQNFQFALGAVF